MGFFPVEIMTLQIENFSLCHLGIQVVNTVRYFPKQN